MYYLDYKAWGRRLNLGEMRVFSYSQFGHSLDFDANSDRLRIYFKTEEEMSFFMLYWVGNENRND